MSRSRNIYIAGRRVKFYAVDPVNGRQSVSICTPANKAGQYEEVFYRSPGRHVFVQPGQYTSLDAFKNFMRGKDYRQTLRVR